MTNKPVFDINTTTYSLSIQLSLNGFSFCIATKEGKIVTSFTDEGDKNKYTEHELYTKINQVFSTKPELQATFNTVEVIYQNDLFALVPHELFDGNNKKNYLNYSVKTLATDYITHDAIKGTNIINVFIPYININNFLIDQLGEFNYQHSSALLISHALEVNKQSTAEKVYLYFSKNIFEVIITKESKLLFFNTFSFSSNEDILYYILFCIEQLSLSPNEVELELLNIIDGNLYELVYTYVRNVKKAEPNTEFLLHHLALNL